MSSPSVLRRNVLLFRLFHLVVAVPAQRASLVDSSASNRMEPRFLVPIYFNRFSNYLLDNCLASLIGGGYRSRTDDLLRARQAL